MTVIHPRKPRSASACDHEARLPPLDLLQPEAMQADWWWRTRSRRHRGAPPLVPSLELATALARLPTGGWRIKPATASVLAALAEATRPLRILEFGSGVSTAVFALAAAAGGSGGRVIAIEESDLHAARTRSLLQCLGIAAYASVVIAPVNRRRIGDWEGFLYCPAAGAVEDALGNHRADFVFVDGPASWGTGRGDCRFGALLAARVWTAEAALFAADDCLRRRDLAIFQRWGRVPGIEILGVLPVGSGLGLGVIRSQ
jgi:predicted O-methyltransferase YrrM